MTLIVTLGIAAFAICICSFYNTIRLFLKFKKYGGKIPGPRAHPIFGNISLFQGKSPKELYDIFKQTGIEYQKNGKSLMRFQLMSKMYVFPLNGNSLVKLFESTTEINKSEDYQFLDPWLGGGLIMEGYGNRWKSHRKMLTPTFHFAKLEGYLEVFNAETKVLMDLLSETVDKDQGVNIYSLLRRYALDVICQTAMGKKVDAQHNPTHEYVKANNGMMLLATMNSFNPLMWNKITFKLLGYQKEFDKYLKILLNFSKNIIKERKEAIASGNIEKQKTRRTMNFLDLLLEMKESNVLNDEDIRQEVDNFVMAGHETTAISASWTIWNLAHHPEVQEKVYQEVIEVFGEDPDGIIDLDGIKKLSYTDRVMKETKRLFPPIPLIDRKLRNELIIDGYTIPSETIVAIFPPAIHNNPTVYDNPDVFNPDRFLQEEIAKRHAFDYIPFSAGVRNCIGQKFSQLNEKVIISQLIRNFKIVPMKNYDETQPTLEAASKPSNEIQVKFVRRTNKEK